MFDDEKIGRIPDDFWDLSSLVPKKNLHVPAHRSIDAVELDISHDSSEQNNTVIERRIPSRGVLKIRPVINAWGTVTKLGGSLMDPEVLKELIAALPEAREQTVAVGGLKVAASDKDNLMKDSANVRITVDSDIYAGQPAAFLSPATPAFPVLDAASAVLEVKTDDRLPVMIGRILEAVPRQPQSYSKFAMSFARLHGIE